MSQLSIVLVGVQGPRNIGSICRVMGNFGCQDLRLVAPATDHLCDEARHMAVKSGDILENAKIFNSLEEALRDCHLSFGSTRRFGKYREQFLSPSQAASLLHGADPQSRCAMVFGREDNGLTTAELALCSHFLTIETDAALPSMNIAQAVAVCLYEAYSKKEKTDRSAEYQAPVSSGEMEQMLHHMKKAMLDIDYLNPQNPEHIFMTYRRIFNRAVLSERDIRILHGLWAKIEYVAAKAAD